MSRCLSLSLVLHVSVPLLLTGCCVVSARPSRLEHRFPEHWNGTGAGREIHWEKPDRLFPLSVTHARSAAHTHTTKTRQGTAHAIITYVILKHFVGYSTWILFILPVQRKDLTLTVSYVPHHILWSLACRPRLFSVALKLIKNSSMTSDSLKFIPSCINTFSYRR